MSKRKTKADLEQEVEEAEGKADALAALVAQLEGELLEVYRALYEAEHPDA